MSTDAATGTSPGSARRRTWVPRLGLARFSGLYVWAVFVAVYAVWIPDTFLRDSTAQSIASTQAVTGLVALGLVCALAAGAFDLSFASTLGLSSSVAAALMVRADVAPAAAIAICVAMGAAIGAVNGLLVARAGISSIVATLGTSSLLMAANEKVTSSQFIPDVPRSFTDLTAAKPLGIPSATLYLLVVAVVVWAFLEHTRSGRRMLATGSGTQAARLAGVATGRTTFAALAVSSTLASVAGLVALSQIGAGAPDLGPGYLLPVFAAVFLGTTQVKPGRFNVWGTILAIYLLATGVKGLQLAGGESWITQAFNGAALLAAVGFAQLSARRRR